MRRKIQSLLHFFLILLAISIILFIAFRSRYREILGELDDADCQQDQEKMQ